MAGRSLRIALHEELARQWEAAHSVAIGSRDAAWHARVQQLEVMYRQDVGCHPRDRLELAEQIETAIENGSQRTPAEILALFGS